MALYIYYRLRSLAVLVAIDSASYAPPAFRSASRSFRLIPEPAVVSGAWLAVDDGRDNDAAPAGAGFAANVEGGAAFILPRAAGGPLRAGGPRAGSSSADMREMSEPSSSSSSSLAAGRGGGATAALPPRAAGAGLGSRALAAKRSRKLRPAPAVVAAGAAAAAAGRVG